MILVPFRLRVRFCWAASVQVWWDSSADDGFRNRLDGEGWKQSGVARATREERVSTV